MSVVGVIPARYQSSRFPGKPLIDIHGKPMIQHVYERAGQAHKLDRLLIATDDRRILEAARSFGGECLLTRDDHASGTDRVAEVCELLDLPDSDIIINIQGDEPLLLPEMIEQLIEVLHAFPECCMATLAFPSSNRQEYFNPNVVKIVADRNGKALYFSRSPLPYFRDDPATTQLNFLKHLGFYAYRLGFLRVFTKLPQGILETTEKLEQLRALEHGYPIFAALTTTDTLGVDTPEDLKMLLERHYQILPRGSSEFQ
jgi:3-deoxy-manno-octulosonate cytidylyltransferase (CMP-KDO synthetase)